MNKKDQYIQVEYTKAPENYFIEDKQHALGGYWIDGYATVTLRGLHVVFPSCYRNKKQAINDAIDRTIEMLNDQRIR